MLQRIRQLVIPALILAGGAGGLFWLSSLRTPPARVTVPYQPPLVETGTVAVHTDTFPIRIHGVVVPYREVRIAAEVTGRIVEKADRLRSGRVVNRNDRLLSIDPEPYAVAVDQFGHELRQLIVDQERVTLETEQTRELAALAEKQVALATRELDRLQELRAQETLSQSTIDRAERSALDARRELVVLRQRIKQLPLQHGSLGAKRDAIASQLLRAQLDLRRTEIIAPFDAIVTADMHEVGSFVETGDHLLTLQDPARFEVSCSLRSDDLFWLRASTELDPDGGEIRSAFELPEAVATVTYQTAGESYSWPGRLVRAEGAGFDPATRTLACRVVVDQPRRDGEFGPRALVAGMFVDVEFNVAPRMELLALPRAALQPDGRVWVVADGKLTVHSERPARITPSVVLLRIDRTKIEPGSRVVVSTLPNAFDGMDVRERSTP